MPMRHLQEQAAQRIQAVVDDAKDASEQKRLIKAGWTVVEIGNLHLADFNHTVGNYLLSKHSDEFVARLCDIPMFLFRAWRAPTDKEQRLIDQNGAVDKPFDPEDHTADKRLTREYRVARWRLNYMVGNAWMREHNVSNVTVTVGQLIKPTEDSAVLWLPRGDDVLDQLEQISKGGNTVLYMMIDDVNTHVSLDPQLHARIVDKIDKLQDKTPVVNGVATTAVVVTHVR